MYITRCIMYRVSQDFCPSYNTRVMLKTFFTWLVCRTLGPAMSRLFFLQFQEISSCRDEFTVFAEHVAIRLKNITDVHARLVAQHQINNILFEAEMGKYNMHSSFNTVNSEITENLDEPSTSNEEKVMINIT